MDKDNAQPQHQDPAPYETLSLLKAGGVRAGIDEQTPGEDTPVKPLWVDSGDLVRALTELEGDASLPWQILRMLETLKAYRPRLEMDGQPRDAFDAALTFGVSYLIEFPADRQRSLALLHTLHKAWRQGRGLN